MDAHNLTVMLSKDAEEVYLDGTRVKGLTGYSIKSQLDGKHPHIELVLELVIPKMTYTYFLDKNWESAADVTPSATAEIADKE